MKSLLILGAVIAALTAASVNAAAYRFSYQASELQTTAGREALYERIVRTARATCETPGPRPLESVEFETKCVEGMIDDIVAQIDNPRLSSLHNERTRQYAQR